MLKNEPGTCAKLRVHEALGPICSTTTCQKKEREKLLLNAMRTRFAEGKRRNGETTNEAQDTLFPE
jgi:hypothetical protein